MSEFFTNSVVQTFLGLGVCFALAALLMRLCKPLRKVHMPLAIVAGAIGVLARYIDPTWMDVDVLKPIVYHGLALVFITVGLQVPPANVKTRESLSIGFAISSMGAMQGFLGAGIIMLLSTLQGSQMHIGMGLLLPLGFNQGPGQALSFGGAWESTGLLDGADIGIIIAALGFVWSIVVGVPLVLYGKRKGWLQADLDADVENRASQESESPMASDSPSESNSWLNNPETLTTSVAWVVVTYFVTYLLIDAAAHQLVDKVKIVNMLWGLHFIIALFVAMGMRTLFMRGASTKAVDAHNQRLQVVSNLSVDITTASGLVAIQIAVLSENLGTVLLLTAVGGLATLAFALLLFRKVFHRLPFHHLVVWFGSCTGTFPVGLSLLRMIDPNLSTPCATNYSKGSAFALITSAPLLALLAYAIGQYPDSYPAAGWSTLGLLFVYWILLVFGWSRLWVKSSD